jgi:recombinational DNA repair ATPase RecF
MDDTLLDLVLQRLDSDHVTAEVSDVLLAACDGDEQLTQVLGGGTLVRPRSVAMEREHVEPAGAYLTSVSVTGFRGIGPEATLPVGPGPGLTLVIGRNGSGKSSFAEALEILLTGGLRRWDDRASVWREGWRNLHETAEPAIRAEFVLEDLGPAVVERRWPDGTNLDEGGTTVQVSGEKRASLERLGWSHDLAAYRPFLSHNELEAFLGRPSELYDLLAAVLGLEELTTTLERLAKARLQRESALTTVKNELRLLLGQLSGVEDERAIQCAAALQERTWDLEAALAVVTSTSRQSDDSDLGWLRLVAQLAIPTEESVLEAATKLRDAAGALDAVAGTEATRSMELAGLLDAALNHHAGHGDGDCPVCGRIGALDAAWRERTEEAVIQLKAEAASANTAESEAQTAVNTAGRLFSATPETLVSETRAGLDTATAASAWSEWLALPAGSGASGLRALADHLETAWEPLAVAIDTLSSEATAILTIREDRWAPMAAAVAAWCERGAEATRGAVRVPGVKKAETWLKAVTDDIRNARLAPLADHARVIWQQLRQESNVELGAIRLSGSRTRRDVDLDVTVDGVPGAALGVMSQGEINAMALSIFLPRATLPASPFRFLVIDDPVQAMDPAKVDGLARVLETVARDRQVVVFTHDNRLPEAVRRLAVAATILEVTRRPGSIVDVRLALDPIARALDDAAALCADEDLPEEVAVRVVPGLCRLALEASFIEVARRRELASGVRYDALDIRLEQCNTLTRKAAFALLRDETKGGEVLSRLNGWGRKAGDTYRILNKGAHSAATTDLRTMVADTRWLVGHVRDVRW